MSDEQRSRRWLVKVKGCDQVSVLPSESLEIGRKPIRPLPDDGVPRFEIPDDTRSMSKRHAVLHVRENGSAVLRDLHSTNGTYLVHEDGRLIRVPADIDFPLPSTAVRMQFGDVPIDFAQVEDNADLDPDPVVADLFSYAADDEKATEPDAADMSVDDILNLRAGEPTSAFDANSVARRASALRAAALQSFTPMVAPVVDENRPEAIAKPVPLHVDPLKPEEPRDLFVDAMSKASHVEPSTAEASSASNAPSASNASNADSLVSSTDEQTRPVVQRMPVIDAVSVVTSMATSPTASSGTPDQATAPDASVENISGDVSQRPSASFTDAENESGAAPDMSSHSSGEPAQERKETLPAETAPSTQPVSAQESIAGQEQHVAYTPVFEPGSVFDRVARGEFRKPETTVEVDGLSSDDAKRTTDYSVQFNMAGHPELLPFLAMNPSLYYDLYRWLEARGDKDIDAALASNPGYQEYRSAAAGK